MKKSELQSAKALFKVPVSTLTPEQAATYEKYLQMMQSLQSPAPK